MSLSPLALSPPGDWPSKRVIGMSAAPLTSCMKASRMLVSSLNAADFWSYSSSLSRIKQPLMPLAVAARLKRWSTCAS